MTGVGSLIRLKRHERPPAGYFDGFSAEVMARIEIEPPPRPASWLDGFDARTLLISTYAVVVLGAFLAGLTLAGGGGEWDATPGALPAGASTWLRVDVTGDRVGGGNLDPGAAGMLALRTTSENRSAILGVPYFDAGEARWQNASYSRSGD